jgi:hypothetical protein
VLAGLRAPLDAEPDLEVAGEAKTHVPRILMKLGARDRVQLVVMAFTAGLVPGSAA